MQHLMLRRWVFSIGPSLTSHSITSHSSKRFRLHWNMNRGKVPIAQRQCHGQSWSAQDRRWNVMFFGTDHFSLPHLRLMEESRQNGLLIDKLEVVVPQSTFIKRRGKTRKTSPVWNFCQEQHLSCNQWPLENNISGFDVGVIVSFGHLLPEWLINSFPLGVLNVHPSLLPRWRGGAPIQHTVLNGDQVSGVSIMRILPHRFDVGPILLQREYNVPSDSTTESLTNLLAKKGSEMLFEVFHNLPGFIENETPQRIEGATLGLKIPPELAWIDWGATTLEIDRLFRAIGEQMPLKTVFEEEEMRLEQMVSPVDCSDLPITEGDDPGAISFNKNKSIIYIRCKVDRMQEPSIRQPGSCFFPSQQGQLEGDSQTDELVKKLYPYFNDACYFAYADLPDKGADIAASNCNMYSPPSPSSDLNVCVVMDVTLSELPVPLYTLAERSSSVEDFLGNLPTYSPAAVSELEIFTRGQSANPEWFQQRKGRITASVCHSVMTRGRRLLDSQGKAIDCTNLVKRILYSKPDENLPALKYGREMEGEARNTYEMIMTKAGHKNCKVMECGMKVKGDMVYLGASPDGLVSCDCCGEGLLEIKCPSSIADTVPSPDNVPYLSTDRKLEESHMYYSQVQLQMGIWEKSWCDFFVFTKHGNIRIRVPFDQARWDELLMTCEHFFRLKLARELVTRECLEDY